jgi:hypothetical protein
MGVMPVLELLDGATALELLGRELELDGATEELLGLELEETTTLELLGRELLDGTALELLARLLDETAALELLGAVLPPPQAPVLENFM